MVAGMCFQDAGRRILEEERGYLVHAIVRGGPAGFMHHAFYLDGQGQVWEPEHEKWWDAQEFLEAAQPIVLAAYNPSQVADLMLRHRHWGPWPEEVKARKS